MDSPFQCLPPLLLHPAGAPPITGLLSRRARPVTVVGLLLLAQSWGLLGFGPALIALFGQSEAAGPMFQLISQSRTFSLSQGIGTSVLFMPLSVPALVAGIGLLRLWEGAWTLAMLTQGLSLTMALIIYSEQKPIYIYLVMIYSMVVVLYLNYHDVQIAFRPKVRNFGGKDSRRGGER